jgi:hypothetical protein
LSLSPGTLSQCNPESVFDSEMTSEMGREFELPKTWLCQHAQPFGSPRVHTAIAVTKLVGRFLNLKMCDTITAAR